MSRSACSWSNLSHDLLGSIGERIQDSYIDSLNFRAVCKGWRPVISPPDRRPLLLQLPNRFGFLQQFLLCHTAVYIVEPLAPENPQAGGNNRSSWIMKIQGPTLDGNRHVLNPFSVEPIVYLPDWFPDELNLLDYRFRELTTCCGLRRAIDNAMNCSSSSGIYKVSMTSNPCISGNYGVVAIKDGELCCLEIGEPEWRILENDHLYSHYCEIVTYKGYFFAVTIVGLVAIVDQSSLQLVGTHKPDGIPHGEMYFVKSQGDLFLVVRDTGLRIGQDWAHIVIPVAEIPLKFVVYKMIEVHDEGMQFRWVEVTDLGEQVFVVSEDCSFAFSAQDFTGCRGNCIYFLDYGVCMEFSDHEYHYGEDFNGPESDWEYDDEPLHDDDFDGVEDKLSNHQVFVFKMDDATSGALADNPEYPNIFWPPPQWLMPADDSDNNAESSACRRFIA